MGFGSTPLRVAIKRANSCSAFHISLSNFRPPTSGLSPGLLPCAVMSDTPMMQQYQDAKAACPDALLLFRMGDFYELFHDDAKTAPAAAWASRSPAATRAENAVPMAGFPYHQLESYLGKLIAPGMRVADLRAGGRPEAGQGARRTRSDAHRHARHGDRRRAARSARRATIWRRSSRVPSRQRRPQPAVQERIVGLAGSSFRPADSMPRSFRASNWPINWPGSLRPNALLAEESADRRSPVGARIGEMRAHAPARLGVLADHGDRGA